MAHLFISDKGYASIRLREENDVALTQFLFTKPYAQIELSFANYEAQQLGEASPKAKSAFRRAMKLPATSHLILMCATSAPLGAR